MKMHKHFILVLCMTICATLLYGHAFADEQQHTKAMYGIPLGATLDEVLKWCEENNAEVANNTKQGVDEYVKSKFSQMKTFTKAIEKEMEKTKFSCSETEKLMIEMQEAMLGGSYSDLVKMQLKEDIQEVQKILKTPSFIYKDTKYFWIPVFDDGMRFYMDDLIPTGDNRTQEKGTEICTDERITKNTYELQISIVKRDKIIPIRIYFYRNNEKEFKSYAALATYSKDDSSRKLCGMIVGSLNKKYGEYKYIDIGENQLWYSPHALYENSLAWKIFHLTGGFILIQRVLLWPKNIFLIDTEQFSARGIEQHIEFRNPPEVPKKKGKKRSKFGKLHSAMIKAILFKKVRVKVKVLRCPDKFEFHLLYYEPTIAKQIIQEHSLALQECKDNYYKKQQDIKKEVEEDF